MARTPLYKAAETEMIRRIEAGEWEVGKRLPNEFVLAEEFKVSQGTMRRALMTLEGMGLLNRKPGRGTLVAKPG
jgi:GntR family transcriptional regulator